ncbi:MAG: Ig-like domain-containing protein, partial [Sulfurimonas sp.]|uniref:tandem-95 repeat protein n=1 Tax=Sulfurimonas sp. TaxID=2022749 RepID=UPI00262F528C
SITVNPLNDPTVTVNDTASTNEDSAVVIDVLANDTDIDSAKSSVASVTQGSHGTVAINPDGTLTYTPEANYNGADSFTYTNSEGATATVNVTVNPLNDPTVIVNDTASVNEDSAVIIDVLANDTDIDSAKSPVASVTQGAHGTVAINGDGTLTYTPEANYNGADSFTYTNSEGATATVNVTVNPLNDPTVIVNDTAAVNEDASVIIDVLANDTDIDSAKSPVASVTNGAHGTVAINGDGTLTYTPEANYNGADSFTYTNAEGATATVSITVNPLNDAPTNTIPIAQTTTEDAAKVFSSANGNAITVADVDGGTLTTTLSIGNGILSLGSTGGVTVSGNGTGTVVVSGTALQINAALNGLSYTPTADYNGAASLSIVTSDGTLSDSDTVAISVSAVADIVNDTVNTNEDTTVNINVNANDSFENTGHTITAINGTAIAVGGSVSVSNGNVTLKSDGTLDFTPITNYNGSASFNYTVTSGGVNETGSVNVTVNAAADTPDVLVHITKSGVVGSSAFTENFDDGNYTGWTTQTLLKNSFAEILGSTKGSTEATLFGNVAWAGQTSTSQFNNSRWSIVNPAASTYSDDDNTRDLVYNNSDAGDDAQGMLAYSGLSAAQKAYTNYTLSVDLFADTAGPEVNGIGFVFGYQNSDNYFLVRWENPGSRYNPTGGDLYTSYPGDYKRLVLVQMTNGIPTTLGSTTFDGDDWFKLTLSVNNSGMSVVALDASSSATSTLSYAYGTVSGGVTSAPALNTIGLYVFDDDQDVRFDNIQINQGSYQYTLHTAAYLSDVDGSETLSNITLTNIPNEAVLWDSTANSAVTVSSGTASVIAGHDITISTAVALSDAQINGIQASVTATESSNLSTAADTDTAKIDLLGTASGETITGTASNEWLDGKAGADTLNGGAGNDILVLDVVDTLVDGGVGYDTLLVETSIDFRALNDNLIKNIEEIDLGNGTQDISLTLADVISMTDGDKILYITGDASDSVSLQTADNWSKSTTQTQVGFDEYTSTQDPTVKLQIEDDITVHK